MSNILYEKRGRRYFPVAERDAFDGVPKGWWLVHVVPGGMSARRVVDPAFAETEAAMRSAEEAMTEAMRARQEPQMDWRRVPVRSEARYKRAWEAWRREVGDDIGIFFEGVSMRDVVQAGLEALRREIANTKKSA